MGRATVAGRDPSSPAADAVLPLGRNAQLRGARPMNGRLPASGRFAHLSPPLAFMTTEPASSGAARFLPPPPRAELDACLYLDISQLSAELHAIWPASS